MPAFISGDFGNELRKSIIRADQMSSRVKRWSETYDRNVAQELINNASYYPWVPAELTVALVLSGNSNLMESVARHCASRMGQAGLAWGDRGKLQRLWDRESAQRATEWKDWTDG